MPIYKMEGKKDGRQKYRVRINYQDSYGNAKQIDRVIYGLSEAKNLEDELKKDLRNEIANKNITVSQLHEKYIASRTKSVRESTSTKSQSNINNHVIPYLGDVKVPRITVPMFQEWKNTIDVLDLALTTKQNVYKAFRALLNFAVRMGYIPENLLLKAGNFADASQKKKKIQYYTIDEYKKFIAAAKEFAVEAEKKRNYYEWNYYVFFSIAFYTGMRKGEINALCWSDIEDNFITVDRSVNQKAKEGDQITPPKNDASCRTLQLPVPLIKILEEHKERCQQIDGFNASRLICGFDRALRDTTVENRNKKFAEMAELKKIRIHDFRHSHASVLCNEGINIKEIARRLGHSKVETTWNTYSHLYPREEERAVKIFDEIV